QIEEFLVALISQVVPADVDLDAPGFVLNVGEGCLSHGALCHNAAGESSDRTLDALDFQEIQALPELGVKSRGLQLSKPIQNLGGRVQPVEPLDGVRVSTACLQSIQFGEALGSLVQFFHGLPTCYFAPVHTERAR